MKKLLIVSIFIFSFICLAQGQPIPFKQSIAPDSSEATTPKKIEFVETLNLPAKSDYQQPQATSENMSLVEKFAKMKSGEQKIVIGTFLLCLLFLFGLIRYFLTGKQ